MEVIRCWCWFVQVQKPANVWEFYICTEIQKRLTRLQDTVDVVSRQKNLASLQALPWIRSSVSGLQIIVLTQSVFYSLIFKSMLIFLFNKSLKRYFASWFDVISLCTISNYMIGLLLKICWKFVIRNKNPNSFLPANWVLIGFIRTLLRGQKYLEYFFSNYCLNVLKMCYKYVFLCFFRRVNGVCQHEPDLKLKHDKFVEVDIEQNNNSTIIY